MSSVAPNASAARFNATECLSLMIIRPFHCWYLVNKSLGLFQLPSIGLSFEYGVTRELPLNSFV